MEIQKINTSNNNNNNNKKSKILELQKLQIVYILVWCTYRLCVLTMSCFSACVLRRHLMVWAIFAPKVKIQNRIKISVFEFVIHLTYLFY